MATQPEPEITYTATGQGYYRVFVDGVEVSKHLQEKEAVEAAAAWKTGWPNSVVRYTHDYTVEVEMPGLIMDEDAPGPFTPPAETSNPPAQPDPADMDITQVSSTSTEVTYELTWGDVAGEDGYEWKAGGNDEEWRIPESGYNSVGANVTSVQFTVERRTNDIESFACVRSFNENGSSSDGCIGFTVPAAESGTAPDAPTGLSADAVSAGRIDTDWTGSDGAEQYKVHRSTTQGFTVSSSNRITTVSATSYSDTTVAGDTTYYYKVVASNSVGDSDPSNEASATTPEGSTDALLTGETPSSLSSAPSGWSISSTEDFEGGITTLSRFSTCDHATDRSNTGTGSVKGTFTGDGQQNGGSMPTISGTEFYASWYEYIQEEARWNDEFVMSRGLLSSPFQEIMLDYMHAKDFNETVGNYLIISQGSRSKAFWGTSGQLRDERPRDRWVQYEFRVKANTPGSSDGEIDLWRDGTKLLELRSVNLNGDVDMTGMKPVIGGTYTKHNWRDPNDNCNCGDYIGDGVSFAGHECFETNPVRCKDWVAGCDCPPTPPIFDHWIDDIIILER